MGSYSPFSDGTYTSATFNTPVDLVIDPSGQIYLTDWGNAAIRKLSGGNVSTLAGGGTPGLANGPSSTAQFNRPQVTHLIAGKQALDIRFCVIYFMVIMT